MTSNEYDKFVTAFIYLAQELDDIQPYPELGKAHYVQNQVERILTEEREPYGQPEPE